MALFTLVEVTLAMAVPFLAIAGYHALLDSRAGRFVDEPGIGEPGWRAVVEPSPVVAVVETADGAITGVALLAGHTEQNVGGAVILVPGTLRLGDATLDQLGPEAAVAELSAALRLQVSATEIMAEEDWAAFLGEQSYRVSNPDPGGGRCR